MATNKNVVYPNYNRQNQAISQAMKMAAKTNYEKGYKEGIDHSGAMHFYLYTLILSDELNIPLDNIKKVHERVNVYIEQIIDGEVSFNDIKQTVEEELGIKLPTEES